MAQARGGATGVLGLSLSSPQILTKSVTAESSLDNTGCLLTYIGSYRPDPSLGPFPIPLHSCPRATQAFGTGQAGQVCPESPRMGAECPGDLSTSPRDI